MKMQPVIIRIAHIDDVDQIAVLFNGYRQFYNQTDDVDLARKFIADRLLNKDSTIFLAVNQAQRMLGFCQLYPTFCSVLAAPIYVLYDLFVDESARGMGVGKSLMLTAQEHSKKTGYVRLDLTTAKSNLAAQALYESLGWVRDNKFFSYSKVV